MALRDEVTAKFDEARERIKAQLPLPGTLHREGDPTPQTVAINENFTAIADSLHLLADAIDELRDKGD